MIRRFQLKMKMKRLQIALRIIDWFIDVCSICNVRREDPALVREMLDKWREVNGKLKRMKEELKIPS